jgi:hypothetical protein
MMFDDRVDAARRLVSRLEHLCGRPVVVLGLPRGGGRPAAALSGIQDGTRWPTGQGGLGWAARAAMPQQLRYPSVGLVAVWLPELVP